MTGTSREFGCVSKKGSSEIVVVPLAPLSSQPGKGTNSKEDESHLHAKRAMLERGDFGVVSIEQ